MTRCEMNVSIRSGVLAACLALGLSTLSHGAHAGMSLNVTDLTEPVMEGQSRIAVIRTNFLDRYVQCSVSSIRDLMFTSPSSVASRYEEISGGRLGIDGDVADRLAPANRADHRRRAGRQIDGEERRRRSRADDRQ